MCGCGSSATGGCTCASRRAARCIRSRSGSCPCRCRSGRRPRLILIHLNGEALRTGSATIEVEDSMTAFVKRLLRRDPNGREIGSFKSQLGALSASLVRLATIDGHRTVQIDTKVVTAFDLVGAGRRAAADPVALDDSAQRGILREPGPPCRAPR